MFGVQTLAPSVDLKWYEKIVKPWWNPPRWVFPAVWIPLKLMQARARARAPAHDGRGRL